MFQKHCLKIYADCFSIVSFNLVPKLDSDLLAQPGWVVQLLLDWKMHSASTAWLVPEASLGQIHGVTTHTHFCPVFQKRTCRLCAKQGSLGLIETKKSCRIFKIVLEFKSKCPCSPPLTLCNWV